MHMKNLLKFEYLLISAAIVGIYLSLGYAWYWLPLLFLVFDLSAAGYLINKKVGAITYNIVHSLILPSVLLIACMVTGNKDLIFIDLLWFFHISVDRTLGFGLKYYEGFHRTHLGPIRGIKK
jgi:Domain of unknown function (DUF4260)